jgi:hypothetical protein
MPLDAEADSLFSFLANLRRTAALLIVSCLFGLGVAFLIRALPISQPSPNSYNVFHVLFVRDEIPGLILMMFALSGLSLALYFETRGDAGRATSEESPGRVAWLFLCAGVLALTSIGTFLVCRNYPLSMDEYLARFQATIFTSGHLTAVVPSQWRPWGEALSPKTMPVESASHAWVSNYLPVWAGILALFQIAGVPWLAGPLLAAGSIGLLAAIRKNVDAAWKWNPWVAGLILATSCQFLITAMTTYAMTAHLFFNLLWLWFFTLPRRSGYALAAWVGFLAVGLHQPIVHLAFAFPFLFRLVRERAWGWSFYFFTIYGGALVCYSFWLHLGQAGAPASVGRPAEAPYLIHQASQLFHFPNIANILILLESMGMALAWASPLGLILFVLSLSHMSRWPSLARDLFYGLLLTILVYFFFKSDQGHGWGYRYFHGVLGNFVILAAMGFEFVREHAVRSSLNRILWLNAVLVLLVFLPVRFYQVETFIAPFARMSAYIAAQPDRYLILDASDIWYGCDLIRNDPLFQKKPLVFSGQKLTPSERGQLLGIYPVRIVTGRELENRDVAEDPSQQGPDLKPNPR